jgi:hypothetical protein
VSEITARSWAERSGNEHINRTFAAADEANVQAVRGLRQPHRRRYDAWLDLFTDDGVLDRMGTRVAGRRARALPSGAPHHGGTRHLCANFTVDVTSADEIAASATCCSSRACLAPGQAATVSGAPSVVEYHDRYRRTPQE